MNAKTLLLSLFAFVSIAVALDVLRDSNECNGAETDDCITNTKFVVNRYMKNDLSVAFSYYIHMNMTEYEETIPLQDFIYSGNLVEPEPHTKPDPAVKTVEEENLKQALSTSLGDVMAISRERKINYYVVYAAIDLMNYHYTKMDTNGKVWKFSTKQLIEELRYEHDYDDIMEVINYLLILGVCEEEEYQKNIGCQRYKIDSYIHHKDEFTNQVLIDSVNISPLYVQVGIHPMYFQFYSPNCEHPVHAGYTRPSFAGVLTGYNMTTSGEEYWELYIRRHGDNYNRVNLACVFEKDGNLQTPFAGIASKMYQITVENTEPVERVVITGEGDKITSTAELVKAVEALQGDSGLIYLAIYLDRLDCSEGNTIDIVTSYPVLKELTLVLGDDYTCLLNGFETINYDDNIGFTMPSVEEFEGTTARRLVEYADVSSLTEATLSFVGKSITSLKLGSNLFGGFNYELIIKDCPKLKTIIIGNNTFPDSSKIVIDNNPLLTTIEVGEYTFGKRPVIKDSEFVMRDLPELSFIEFFDHAFDNIRVATVDTIQDQEYMEIHGENAFSSLELYTPSGNIHTKVNDYFERKAQSVEEPTLAPSSEPVLV